MVNGWYYYLHTNGDLIGKSPAVVDSDPQYFNSSFVRRVWLIEDRKTLVGMLIEAKLCSASPVRIKEIEEANSIKKEDYDRYLKEDV